jgi:hypothetical protein
MKALLKVTYGCFGEVCFICDCRLAHAGFNQLSYDLTPIHARTVFVSNQIEPFPLCRHTVMNNTNESLEPSPGKRPVER